MKQEYLFVFVLAFFLAIQWYYIVEDYRFYFGMFIYYPTLKLLDIKGYLVNMNINWNVFANFSGVVGLIIYLIKRNINNIWLKFFILNLLIVRLNEFPYMLSNNFLRLTGGKDLSFSFKEFHWFLGLASIFFAIYIYRRVSLLKKITVKTSTIKRSLNFSLDSTFILISLISQHQTFFRTDFYYFKNANVFDWLWVIAIFLYIPFFYYLLSEYIFGQSLAKVFTKTYVRNSNLSLLSFNDAVKRTISRFLPLGFLSFIVYIFTPKGTVWHDEWSNTTVFQSQKQ